jgi:hypothetical protein
VRFHIHFSPTEAHAFGFQPESLLDRGIAAQFNLSARTQHPLPGQSESIAQDRGYLPRGAWRSCGTRHTSVG